MNNFINTIPVELCLFHRTTFSFLTVPLKINLLKLFHLIVNIYSISYNTSEIRMCHLEHSVYPLTIHCWYAIFDSYITITVSKKRRVGQLSVDWEVYVCELEAVTTGNPSPGEGPVHAPIAWGSRVNSFLSWCGKRAPCLSAPKIRRLR